MDFSGQAQLWQSAMQSALALTEAATQAFSSVATESARQTAATVEEVASAPIYSQSKRRTRAKSWYRDPRETSPFDLWLKACSPENLFGAKPMSVPGGWGSLGFGTPAMPGLPALPGVGAVLPWNTSWPPSASWPQMPFENWTGELVNFAGNAVRQWGASGHQSGVGQTDLFQAFWPAAPVWPAGNPATAWGAFNRSTATPLDLQAGLFNPLRPTIWF